LEKEDEKTMALIWVPNQEKGKDGERKSRPGEEGMKRIIN